MCAKFSPGSLLHTLLYTQKNFFELYISSDDSIRTPICNIPKKQKENKPQHKLQFVTIL